MAENPMLSGWRKVFALVFQLRVIYEDLKDLPLSPFGSTAVTMMMAHLEQG